MNNLEEVLYLNPLELSGPEQMAIDLFLLEKSFSDQNFKKITEQEVQLY